MPTRILRALAGGLALLPCALLGAQLRAQDQVLQWSPWHAFDSRLFEEPLAKISCATTRNRCLALTTTGEILGFGGASDDGVLVPPAPNGLRYTDVVAGEVSIAKLSNGELVQIGSFQGSLTPTPIPSLPAGVTWVDYCATSARGFALRSDGILESWGTDWAGIEQVPQLAPRLRYEQVVVGGGWAAALVSDGTVRAWGPGAIPLLTTPNLPAGVRFVRLVPGANHLVALRSDGRVGAWGSNRVGQCNVPPLPPGVTYVKVGSGTYHSMALRSDGQWLLWGLANYDDITTLPPHLAGKRLLTVAGGANFSVALRPDRRLEVWGWYQTPRVLPRSVKYRDLASRDGGAEILDSEGRIRQFMTIVAPYLGQVSGAPPEPPIGQRFVMVRGTGATFAGLLSDGSIRTWGADSPAGIRQVPALPIGLAYTHVSLGTRFAVALRSNGSAVAWPGNGSATMVPGLPVGMKYVDAAAGHDGVVLLRSDGLIVVTGPANSVLRQVPALPAGVRFTAVACGGRHAAALRSDGEVSSWPTYGQSVPALPAGTCYVDVECGRVHTLARRSDGEVVAWGPAGYRWVTPKLPAGRSYHRISVDKSTDNSTALIGSSTAYVGIGNGCAGSRPTSQLVPNDTPQIGRTLRVRVRSLPTNIAFMGFAWRRLANPIDLTGIGAPGCRAFLQPDTTVILAGANGEAFYEMPVPFTPALIGLRFYNQAVVPDPNAGNAIGAVVSDAMRGVVGG